MENKYRTKYCGELTEADIDKEVKVAGFVENIRDHGGVIFVDIRDNTGVIQVVSNDDSVFDGITRESSITLSGKIRKRGEDDYNERISTGTIELLVESLEVLGKASNVLPFEVMTSRDSGEETRLKYRYLDLRNPKVKDTIIFRTKVIDYMREIMKGEDFLEITTPILTASSPEGARDFIVPSRKFKGKFYALPQAPQQFKQLLMCGGFDKYFQIAPCFRDEDARSDRIYGEFYQLDFEMSFAEEEDVLRIGEKVFYDTFKKFSDKKITDTPFPRLSFKEAMDRFGTDKPDLRNPLELIDLTDVFEETSFRPFRGVTVKGIVVDDIASKSNSWFNELVDYAKTIGMPGIGYFKVMDDMSFAGPIDKFLSEDEREDLIEVGNLKPGSVIFFIADRKNAAKNAGLIRDELGRKLELINDDEFKFCIVKDFPMYEWSEEEDQYIFTHNPFSMPQGGMDALTSKKPEEVLAYQFDFVCNGLEMASGAVRNHDLDIMKKAFEIAGYSEEELKNRFKALYEAFKYGAPPHAGMAPGIDRMLMLLLDEKSIRETIAFPMSAAGSDAMMDSPSEVTEMQLREAHIKVRD
ncbi:MAG: aspartate--tRNA ligase [Bacilli bacterium]|nr:aspartate--tRNA ligase [Bacilli bacterium]MBR3049691.1 aspartate--tRNA ligase [Bacilli bacterium]